MAGLSKRRGHLLVAGTRRELMDRLLERSDVVEGHPNYRGTLSHDEGEHDDRMRLIATRTGFALWSPLAPEAGSEGGILPTMVEVSVRPLNGRCALTVEQRMHPRTVANHISLALLSALWVGVASLGPALWVAMIILPAFLVLPLHSIYQAGQARSRSRRAWDALLETLAPLQLTQDEGWRPFRELPLNSRT